MVCKKKRKTPGFYFFPRRGDDDALAIAESKVERYTEAQELPPDSGGPVPSTSSVNGDLGSKVAAVANKTSLLPALGKLFVSVRRGRRRTGGRRERGRRVVALGLEDRDRRDGRLAVERLEARGPREQDRGRGEQD